MKRVLVTGGSGFVGEPALARLVELSYEVHAVRRPQSSRASQRLGDSVVTWHEADLLSGPGIDELLALVRPSHLLHLAWFAEPGQFWNAPSNLAWVQASLALLRAFATAGGTRAVIAGSYAEYDWTRNGHCSERATPCRPGSFYGICKNALQELATAYGRNVGMSVAWGRLFLLYGPREHPARLVSSMTSALLRGQPALCSEGSQQRDFLHVADVAGALCALLDSAIEGPVNVCSGEPVSIRDVVQQIAAECGAIDQVRLGAIANRAGDPHLLVGDPSRLRDEVGWAPRYDLPSGLAATVAWWRLQG